MNKVQKFLIVSSAILVIGTCIILSLYSKCYEFALDEYILPISTMFAMKWRYAIAGLALILSIAVLIPWRKPAVVSGALFLGMLINSLSLLLLMKCTKVLFLYCAL